MIRTVIGLGILLVASITAQESDLSRMQAVEASAQVQEAPPRITLVWPGRSDAAGYKISRREGQSWNEVASLGGGATSWTDGNVSVGQRYEYRIVKTTAFDYIGQTYITAGIRANALEDTGKALVLVRDNVAGALGGELNQFTRDLVLEGWEVQRQDVGGATTVPELKSFIQGVWQSSGGKLKSVILLGHLPVPYSGKIFPDGHENHEGAWPADGFYADVDGTWTDSSVNVQTSERDANWNVPGDGKYDQSIYPTAVELALGRVDLSDMTCYANKPAARSEIDLMRQYLNKNHQFRSGQLQIARKAMLLDNFGLRETNGVAASGWRNFAAFFEASNVEQLALNTYFSRLRNESALCTWGAGGGSYYYSSGIGTSDDFATIDVNVVFSFWLGSYFGDWNNESNWLRAALGSGTILVSTYSGIPHTLFHGMALGGTVGESFVLTQNNKIRDEYYPDTQGLNEVHQALLGDPTLRLFPRGALSGVTATGGSGRASVNWVAPSGNGYLGVFVYRGSSANGSFARVTASPVGGNSYADSVGAGSYVYLVRPVWLETSGSGTFMNVGQGATSGTAVVTGGGGGQIADIRLSAQRKSATTISITVQGEAGKGVVIESASAVTGWAPLNTITLSAGGFTFDVSIAGETGRFYRAKYSGNP